jgi:hypothetical protein
MVAYLTLEAAAFEAAAKGQGFPTARRTRKQELGYRIYAIELAPFPASSKVCAVVFSAD